MYYLYIIKSEVDGSFYTGQCENLSKRVQHHNSGYAKSTKEKMPWQLVYYESYNTRSEAVKREVEIKKKKSRKCIEKLISEFPKNKICGAVASASGGSAVADRY